MSSNDQTKASEFKQKPPELNRTKNDFSRKINLIKTVTIETGLNTTAHGTFS
jgi:hypothetical protein